MSTAMPRLTYPEYLELQERSEERLEWIAGVVHAMAGGTTVHARLSSNMLFELRMALDRFGCRVTGSDLRVRIDAADRSTYPDVLVVCGPDQHAPIDPHAITNPTMLAEVLSPSTEASDRGDKWRDYQRLASLREYILVAQDEPRVEVFSRRGEHDAWQHTVAGAGEHVELSSHGVRLSVDAIYSRLR